MRPRIIIRLVVFVGLLALACLVATIVLATWATWEFNPDIQARLTTSAVGTGSLIVLFGVGAGAIWGLSE